jgi:predicted Zn finger-like uncharacterized protein
MPEEKYTRCPECRTVYRVTPEQLAMRGGQVRCGQCKTAFDGVEQLISLAPPPFDDGVVDEAAQGPPTVTLRSGQALTPPPSSDRDARAAAPPGAPDTRRGNPVARALSVLAAVALVALLAGQAVFHYRDAVVAQWPAAKPLLAEMCAVVGCTVLPPHQIADLPILASDLQADPAHRGLLILTATLRNRAAIALAYPHLELSLTDARDQVVVRRALTPAEYAGGTADLAQGIPANGEVAIKLFIDASATTQAGYRLDPYYP